MRCHFCKQLLGIEGAPICIGGKEVCKSCAEKVVEIQVYDDDKLIDTISRIPIDRKGWQSVKYKRGRYQLFGGIRRGAYRIQLKLPCHKAEKQ